MSPPSPHAVRAFSQPVVGTRASRRILRTGAAWAVLALAAGGLFVGAAAEIGAADAADRRGDAARSARVALAQDPSAAGVRASARLARAAGVQVTVAPAAALDRVLAADAAAFELAEDRHADRATAFLLSGLAIAAVLLVLSAWFVRSGYRLAREAERRREREARRSGQIEAIVEWSNRAKAATTRNQLIGFAHQAPKDALGAVCLSANEGAPPEHHSHGHPRFEIRADDAGEGLYLSLCYYPGRGDEPDHDALHVLLAHLSALWRTVLRNEELERAAGHDALTGLPNRRLFDAELRRRIAVFRRRGLRFALAIVDLDHFKAVNDSLGHVEGDTVLRRSADAIRGTLRASDAAFRLGGEEFALIVETDDTAGVAQLLERTREAVKDLGVEPSPGRRLSASVGWAVYPDDVESRSGLIEHADAALYVAKNTGRDRVARADARRAA